MFGTYAQATFFLVTFVEILLYTNIFATHGAILYIQLRWKSVKFQLARLGELKFLGPPKFFWDWKFFWDPKFFGTENFFRHIALCKILWTTFLKTNNFWPKLFRTRLKFSRTKIFWTQIFCARYCFSPSIFTGKKMLEHKIIWTQILFGYKFFWHKISLKYFLDVLELRFLMKLKFFYQNICLNAFFNPSFSSF